MYTITEIHEVYYQKFRLEYLSILHRHSFNDANFSVSRVMNVCEALLRYSLYQMVDSSVVPILQSARANEKLANGSFSSVSHLDQKSYSNSLLTLVSRTLNKIWHVTRMNAEDYDSSLRSFFVFSI
jgi:hypothetical protein